MWRSFLRNKKITVIDLFAGVGGLSFGFEKDDHFQVLAANEILPNMAKAYELNHPNVRMYTDDIGNLTGSKILDDCELKAGELDILVGGPPCQAYSTVGKRLLDDPRGKLFQDYYRLLKDLKPKVFIYENVSGLLSMNGGTLLPHIMELFSSLGYKVQKRLLNAADFGAPQIRERVIIFGTSLDRDFHYPEPTHIDPNMLRPDQNLRPWVTLRDALSDLPPLENGGKATKYATAPQNEYQREMRENAPSEIENHFVAKNGEHLVELMKLIAEGSSAWDLPKHQQPSSGFKNTYARLWWDRPSTTITRNLGTPSSSRCIHPTQNRALSTREGARLQGFPDNYKFFGSKSDMNLQIGNAVPTQLSRALARQLGIYFNDFPPRL